MIASAAPAAAPASTTHLPLAGLGRRLAAVPYEALLLTALIFLATFIMLPVVSPAAGHGASSLAVPDLPARVLLFCVLFASAAAYFVACWSGGRRTLPMKTWHLRLVDRWGAPLSRKSALARYLAAWIGPGLALVTYAIAKPFGLGGIAIVPLVLNYLAAFVDPERQFLHDRIAATRVVIDR